MDALCRHRSAVVACQMSIWCRLNGGQCNYHWRATHKPCSDLGWRQPRKRDLRGPVFLGCILNDIIRPDVRGRARLDRESLLEFIGKLPRLTFRVVHIAGLSTPFGRLDPPWSAVLRVARHYPERGMIARELGLTIVHDVDKSIVWVHAESMHFYTNAQT